MRAKMVGTLHIVPKCEEKQLIVILLRMRSMRIWSSVADALLSMIVIRLPLPRVTQNYRVDNLIRQM